MKLSHDETRGYTALDDQSTLSQLSANLILKRLLCLLARLIIGDNFLYPAQPLLLSRDREGEGAALIRHAVNLDATAMRFDSQFAESQTQACT